MYIQHQTVFSFSVHPLRVFNFKFLDDNERIIKHACGHGCIKPHTARDRRVTFHFQEKLILSIRLHYRLASESGMSDN
jgi:hypothetical protein